MSTLLIGWTTFDDVNVALQFARELVQRDLAVCAQVDEAVRSIYKFQDEVHDDRECRLWIKFRSVHAERLSAFISERHPYETPQWIVVKPDFVSEKYLDWVCGRA